MLLKGDSIFYATPLTKYKAKDPWLNDFLENRNIMSVLAVNLQSHNRNFGYIVILEKELSRIWQENEIALIMYISALLEMELLKIEK